MCVGRVCGTSASSAPSVTISWEPSSRAASSTVRENARQRGAGSGPSSKTRSRSAPAIAAAWKTSSGHSITRARPPSSRTVGRVAEMSKYSSGSIVTTASASKLSMRKRSAAEAASPASFQPLKAQTKSGSRRRGRSLQIRSAMASPRRPPSGLALGLVLAQKALEEPAVALLVALDGDDHVLGHEIDAVAEPDDLRVVLDRAGLCLYHALDDMDDVRLLGRRLEERLLRAELERAGDDAVELLDPLRELLRMTELLLDVLLELLLDLLGAHAVRVDRVLDVAHDRLELHEVRLLEHLDDLLALLAAIVAEDPGFWSRGSRHGARLPPPRERQTRVRGGGRRPGSYARRVTTQPEADRVEEPSESLLRRMRAEPERAPEMVALAAADHFSG